MSDRPTDELLTDLVGNVARAALDAVENMLVITRPDGTIVFVNDAFTRTTGYSADEALGSTPRLLQSGLQDDDFYAALWGRILTGERWDGELVNRRKDGSLYTDHMTITPLCDADGAIHHFIAVKRDVSSHVAALTAGSPTGAAHIDASGRLVYANARLETLLGATYDGLLGTGWLEAWEPAAARALLDAIAEAGDAGEVTVTAATRDETVLRVNLAPLHLDTGGTAAGIVATFSDVTDEVRTERDLRDREQYVRTVLDSLASPTAVVDAGGTVRATNAAWQEHADELGVGGTLDVGDDYVRVVRRAADVGAPVVDAVVRAVRAVLDGDDDVRTIDYQAGEQGRWWELRVTPLRTRDGGAVLSHTDVTARRELEQLLHERATTDDLTGLHNRAGLTELARGAFARARRSGHDVTLLVLDLDRFKPVNDEHGHDAGDAVLRAAAQRLRDAFRETDVVARIGGDEFVVLCEDVEPDVVDVLVQRAVDHVEQPVQLDDGTSVRVGASIGVARADPHTPLERAVQQADERMYRAKGERHAAR